MDWWIWALGSPPPDPTPRPASRVGLRRGSCLGRVGPGGDCGGDVLGHPHVRRRGKWSAGELFGADQATAGLAKARVL